MYFTGDDGYQNFLVFAPMLSSLTLDNNKRVTNWILTGVSPEKIKPFATNPEPTMPNLVNGRVILKFSDSVLVKENCFSLFSSFILNLFIVYELNDWYCYPSINFTWKHCLFGTVKLVTNAAKSKFICNGQWIAFDGKGYGVLIRTLLEMFQFLVLIVVDHLILIIEI